MEFEKYLKISRNEIIQQLDEILSHWSKQVEKEVPKLSSLIRLFNESISGGKMIRGTLVKLGYELAQSRSNEHILQPAVAFELLHSALLAHDDIIDVSETRRGKPTIYKALGGNHYGISQTICLGDLGFFLATKLLSESNFSSELKTKAIAVFSDTVITTLLGEMLDVELPHLKKERRENDALTIHRFKTASYTIVAPLSVGAILGNVSPKLLYRLKEFGEYVGLAFQIQDDILGVFGNEKSLGKSVKSDIEEGKNTLLITYALQHANGSNRQFLREHYGNGKINNVQHQEIRRIFRQTGALDYSRSKAQDYVREAKEIVPLITKSEKIASLLHGLSDLVVTRKK